METADDGGHKPEPGGAWSQRERAAAIFFVVFLSLQILIPILRLPAPRPAPFGWQMFSGVRPTPTFTLVKRDGSTERIQLQKYYFHRRAHLRYEDYLPACACRMNHDARAVVIDRGDGSKPEVFTCP